MVRTAWTIKMGWVRCRWSETDTNHLKHRFSILIYYCLSCFFSTFSTTNLFYWLFESSLKNVTQSEPPYTFRNALQKLISCILLLEYRVCSLSSSMEAIWRHQIFSWLKRFVFLLNILKILLVIKLM